jgi:hypothetical protein
VIKPRLIPDPQHFTLLAITKLFTPPRFSLYKPPLLHKAISALHEKVTADQLLVDIYRIGDLEVILMRLIPTTAILLFVHLATPDLRSEELSSSELSGLEWTELTSLEPKESSVGHGELRSGKLISDGKPIRVRGTAVRDGLFAHAPSRLVYDIKDKGYTAIRGTAGLEDIHDGSVKFKILGDGKELWQSEEIIIQKGRAKAARFAISIEGVSELVLVVDDLGYYGWDHSVWISPELGKSALD